MKQNMLRLPHYPWSTLFLDRSNNSTAIGDSKNVSQAPQNVPLETPGDETDDMSIDPEDDSNYQPDPTDDKFDNSLGSELAGASRSDGDSAKPTTET